MLRFNVGEELKRSFLLTVISKVKRSFSSGLLLLPGYCQSRLSPSNLCSRRKLTADLMKTARLSALAVMTINLREFRGEE